MEWFSFPFFHRKGIFASMWLRLAYPRPCRKSYLARQALFCIAKRLRRILTSRRYSKFKLVFFTLVDWKWSGAILSWMVVVSFFSSSSNAEFRHKTKWTKCKSDYKQNNKNWNANNRTGTRNKVFQVFVWMGRVEWIRIEHELSYEWGISFYVPTLPHCNQQPGGNSVLCAAMTTIITIKFFSALLWNGSNMGGFHYGATCFVGEGQAACW